MPFDFFSDYAGRLVRLTNERLKHIREHPEMVELESMIETTVNLPDLVIQSRSDPSAQLCYRRCDHSMFGEMFLCVVIKYLPSDAFILTAYLTDKPKQGEVLWSRKR